MFCCRLPKEEAGELRADSGGASEDPEDGAAFRSNQSQVERSSRYERSGHHLPGRSLRVYCRLAGAPAGTHQRGQVGAKMDHTGCFIFNVGIKNNNWILLLRSSRYSAYELLIVNHFNLLPIQS